MSPSGGLVPSPRTLEVESLEAFDRLVAAGAVAMHGWHAQSLDLR
ncbi:MAG TPA: Rossmann fold nucleotide-binding protein, partial [Arthrobacter sp.]